MRDKGESTAASGKEAYLRGLDGARIETEIEIPYRQACGHRNRLPVETVLQHRSLTAGRPGCALDGALAQSAFVGEDDDAPPRGFPIAT